MCHLYHIMYVSYHNFFLFLNGWKNESYLSRLYDENADGTNRLIGSGEKCLVPTARPFWQYIEDIPNIGVKTRSQYKMQPTVSNWSFDTYFRNKNNEDIEQWMTAPDSEV